MFAALNELLGVSLEQPERSQLTLLCATKTDAGFLVHHFLSFYLRAGCKVCFLALAQSFSHYSFVAQKLVSRVDFMKIQGVLDLRRFRVAPAWAT
ncbi:elongator complex protein 6-like [Crotalus tigris]|uniref:elongator complex protein 6-like n=1 Tax=Crotalus tigris TaxID=88082 RepID=UPI00192F2537|nr:elongator complex protein 6-like [Crotalus tigris]